VTSTSSSVRIVVVGTGTSVGKTWVAREVLAELRRRDIGALGLKPVESGVREGTTTDADRLALHSVRAPMPPPYRLREPLSPHLAARRENRSIDAEEILTYVRSHESSEPDDAPSVVLVETAGGLFSPLDASFTNWDVACSLDPARWLLVAPDALGVLHDLTATLGAARARGRAPDLVVLSAAREPDLSTGTNATELQRLGLVARPFALGRDDPAGIASLVDALLAPLPAE
jgi:dethiobiotin synthetase